jgi:hypothetical protein
MCTFFNDVWKLQQKINFELKLILSNYCALKGLMNNLGKLKIANSFPKG